MKKKMKTKSNSRPPDTSSGKTSGITGEKPGVLETLRYFYGIAWKYSKGYVITMGLSILVKSAIPFPNILLTAQIIDELTGQQRVERLILYAGLLVFSNFILSILKNRLEYRMSEKGHTLTRHYYSVLGKKSMEMDFEYTENPDVLNQAKKAELAFSWLSDGGMEGVSNNIVIIVSSLVTISGVAAIVASLNIWILMILLLVIAINIVIQSKTKKNDRDWYKQLVGINRKWGYYSDVISDFEYGKDIRLFDACRLLLFKHKEYIEENRLAFLGYAKRCTKYALVRALVTAAQQIVVFGYVGWKTLAGAVTLGGFSIYISTSFIFTSSASDAFNQLFILLKNTDFLCEYLQFMRLPPIKERNSGKIPNTTKHVFEFRNVSFKYPGSETLILKNVSIRIPSGQRLSIVGMNGAGKTSFIKLLTRLYDPTEGDILLDGMDIRKIDLEEYYRLFSVVFQDFRLFAFSMKENIVLGTAEMAEKLHSMVEKAGLADKVDALENGLETSVYKTFDKDGVELSGGESQKLSIARALYMDRPVVVLDEPTASLDPVAEYEIYKRFDSLVNGKTAIYISHRLSSCRFCDTIAVFHEGSIIQYGHHDALIRETGKKYIEMFHAQAQYYTEEKIHDGLILDG